MRIKCVTLFVVGTAVLIPSLAMAQEGSIIGGGRTRVLPIARTYDTELPSAVRPHRTGPLHVATAYDDESVVISSAQTQSTEAVVSRLPSRFLPIAREYELPTMLVAAGPVHRLGAVTEFEPTAGTTIQPLTTVTPSPQIATEDEIGTILPRMVLLPEYDDQSVGPPVVITVQPLRLTGSGATPATSGARRSPGQH